MKNFNELIEQLKGYEKVINENDLLKKDIINLNKQIRSLEGQNEKLTIELHYLKQINPNVNLKIEPTNLKDWEENLLIKEFEKRRPLKDIAKLTGKSERTIYRLKVKIEKKYGLNLRYQEHLVKPHIK